MKNAFDGLVNRLYKVGDINEQEDMTIKFPNMTKEIFQNEKQREKRKR